MSTSTSDEASTDTTSRTPREPLTRRQLLRYALVGATGSVAAGALGVVLIENGILPGKLTLDELTGACDVAATPRTFSPLGSSRSGTFYSHFRRRRVGYTVAWPPNHGPGSELALAVMLHGFGGSHGGATANMSPAQAVALRLSDAPIPPMALVTVDGGGGYWHPHPGDNPMGMVVSELIPYCQGLGLGTKNNVGVAGISMGGYGALVFAENYPHLFGAVAAVAPAIWTSYDEARGANAGAYTNRAEFDRFNVVTHAAALAALPLRVASGDSDPFHPGVLALARRLSPHAHVVFESGCHTPPFFDAQVPLALRFLAEQLRH